MRRGVRVGSLIACLCALTAPLGAQFTDYRSPTTGVVEPGSDLREQIEGELEAARWRAGPFRVEPWLGLRNLVYTSEAGQSGADVGAAAGAGVLAYLPLGSDFVLKAQATPEYLWWRENADRRRGLERYAVDLFGFLNRLELRLGAARLDDVGVTSQESTVNVSRREEAAEGEVLLRAAGSTHVFVRAGRTDLSLLEERPELRRFANVDREETFLAVGAQLRRGEDYRFEIGVEDRAFELPSPVDRSGDGVSVYASLDVDRRLYLFRGRLAHLSLDPTSGSVFAPYSALGGELGILWRLGSKTDLDVLVSRDLGVSTDLDVSAVERDQLRLGLSFEPVRRLTVSVFGSVGRDRYLAAVSGNEARSDDVTTIGGALTVPLGSAFGLRFGYSQTDYESRSGAFDRSVDQLTVSTVLPIFGNVFSMR